MRVVLLAMMLQLLKLCIIFLSIAVPGSKGYTVSPSPAFLPVIPSIPEALSPIHHEGSIGSNAPSLPLLPHGLVVPPSPARGSWTTIAPSSPAVANGSFLLPPDALPLPVTAPTPQKHNKDIETSSTPSPTTIALSPPHEGVPFPPIAQGNAPPPLRSSPPQAEHGTLAPNIVNGNANQSHSEEPVSPSPATTPAINLPKISPASQPTNNGSFPPQESTNKGHNPEPVTPESAASPPWKAEHNQPPPPPEAHLISPSILPAPVASPPSSFPVNPPLFHPIIPSTLPAPVASPKSSPSGSFNWKNGGAPPIAVPLYKSPKPLPAVVHSPAQAPAAHKARQIDHAPEPKIPNNEKHTPELPPSASSHEHHHWNTTTSSSAPPLPSPYMVSPLTSNHQDKAIPPSLQPESGKRHHVSPPIMNQSSSIPSFSSPTHSPMTQVSSAPSPSMEFAPHPTEIQAPFLPPRVSPSPPKTPTLPRVQALPPPPPNEECSSTVCLEPYTNSPPGEPCRCVWPMRVGLRLSVSLYTFFPLVSELASEIATGVFMKQSQVRIMGANADEQPEKTVVLIDLVPLGEIFDSTTALFTSTRFWHKKIAIKASYFGDYDVLYVSYPGLAPSPPLPPSTISIIDGGPYSNNGGTIKPLGVDIQKRQHKSGLSRGIVAIITVSVFLALVLCAAAAAAWVMLKYGDHVTQPASTPRISQPSLTKPPGNAASLVGGGGVGSASTSFRSSIAAYTGSAKTFSANDIIKATDNFDGSRILGEGGFGLVYGGILEDGTKVAVKVIKREDHHGDREFLAEVEMLSRLHHRNLVKLIGICTEESVRCLIYELVPNGSVESHLHGIDRENSSLGWSARMKIALGAARGLAYLHEDSSPRVIHRDFKSSNILLEDDFTPKVSDFGLARTATDENNRHISTRVMGTFGYVAPEYAMTGHLLVKSDVYSYGVVLLELLTGRKPVDMSQPPGQENLVAWARPLLASREGLEAIVDPCLGGDVAFESVAKVAAIASMCVQPEVSNRPFMGEVVQALKLVCNECEEAKEEGEGEGEGEGGSRRSTQDLDVRGSNVSEMELWGRVDVERGFSCSVRVGREEEESGSFRRHSYSGPLVTGRSRQLWHIMRRLSGGTVSEHSTLFKL
ncbi:hypothetical protein PIB30_008168 [Stylosanthes scabra]|uniref:Protein kinase domain-containing protein n=1 Tax=Stylosanthes scabra TaxID=79078 RepID=A0ABU6Z5E8_9FABA|nr:hypothetical protein [Stylosanthes scabra]